MEWKPVVGFEGKYEVSSTGLIASLPRNYKYGEIKERTLIKCNTVRGYRRCTLFKDGVRYYCQVHRIVAAAFIPNPDNKPFINHMDENKTNNCIENLMWVTAKENVNWGTCREKISKGNSKPVNQYSKDGQFLKTWNSMTVASDYLKITLSSISLCTRNPDLTAGGYKWRYAKKYGMA